MSLRIWLPLTKDLRNQGLDDVTVTNNGAIFNSAGKLGGCYSFNGSSYITVQDVVLQNIWSYSCWLYSDISSRSWEVVMTCNINGGDTDMQLGLYTRPGGNVIQNTANGQYNASIPMTYGQWNHFVGTFDGTNLKTYLNGVLVNTKTITSAKLDRPKLTIGARCRGSSYDCYFQGLLNDIRIYDHCLSPMEVKEISKGLVLHYPLSDIYVEATTNLITTEDCLSSTCYNGATSKYGYGTNTDMYKIVTTYDGRKGTKVYMGTNGNAAFPYVYINNMYTSDGTNSPPYKTLSFDYYTNIGTSIRPYRLGNGSGTATYRITNKNGVATGTGTDAVSIPVVTNGWNHIEITFHGTAAADSQWGYIQNYPSHTSNTNNFWFFANMQLETKDHVTGYAGVGGTRNSNMVYDCSGFCNNGTISGTLTISNDTPKYEVSTYMPATTIITHNRCLDNTNQEWSCAAWVKPKVAGNYQNLNNFNNYNRLYHGTYPLLYVNDGANDYYNYGNLALPVNQWSHIVFVFKNSTGTKLIYINGENHTNTNGPNKTSTPKGIPDSVIIGNGNYEGGLCDYREYATALSAEDIKSLYNNSAYIDNQGNIYGAVYEEV